MRHQCTPIYIPVGSSSGGKARDIFCNRPSFLFLKNLFIAVCLIKNSDSFMGLGPYGLDLSLQEIHIHLFFILLVFFSGMWQHFRGGANSFLFHGVLSGLTDPWDS